MPKQRISHVKDGKLERPVIGAKKTEPKLEADDKMQTEADDKTQTEDLDDIPLSADQKTSKDFKRPRGAKKIAPKKTVESGVDVESEDQEKDCKIGIVKDVSSSKEVDVAGEGKKGRDGGDGPKKRALSKTKDGEGGAAKEGQEKVYDPKEHLSAEQIKGMGN